MPRAKGVAQGGVEGVDGAVALARGDHPLLVDPELDRGLGLDVDGDLVPGPAAAPRPVAHVDRE